MNRLTDIDWKRWQAKDPATLVFVFRGDEVLLINKKTGLGKGKVNAPGGKVDPGETPEERAEREEAEAYYCKRATEIYESYVKAPRLYKTNDAGERVYLDKEEAAQTIAETRAQKDELCR
mgnify:CR=1 FL=1